jgi:hypothetical protein
LEGKVALVCGASKGVGRTYALSLAAAGARVVAAARSVASASPDRPEAGSLAEVAATARAMGEEVLALGCDISNEDEIARLVGETVANFGRLDILVNNAVRYIAQTEVFAWTRDNWDSALGVNLRAPYVLAREAAPHMISQGAGSIINITSLAAAPTELGTRRHGAGIVYAVSKAALDRLTTYLAEELRPHNVAVNAISPGDVEARQSAGGHPEPEIHGAPIVYLAQQTASTLTSQILHTDTFRKTWGPATPVGV